MTVTTQTIKKNDKMRSCVELLLHLLWDISDLQLEEEKESRER